jgi:hypothetical protein
MIQSGVVKRLLKEKWSTYGKVLQTFNLIFDWFVFDENFFHDYEASFFRETWNRGCALDIIDYSCLL